MNYTPEQIDALWQSAEHWLTNWQALQDPARHHEYNPFSEACACCHLAGVAHSDSDSEDCSYCPIYEYTNQHLCNGTPWDEVIHDRGSNFQDWNITIWPRKIEAAEREYRFLVTLALGEDPKADPMLTHSVRPVPGPSAR